MTKTSLMQYLSNLYSESLGYHGLSQASDRSFHDWYQFRESFEANFLDWFLHRIYDTFGVLLV